MVARRSPKGRRNGGGADASGSLSRSAGFDDIPKDDEDLFEASRDQILLDGYERAAIDSEDDMDVGLNNREVLGIDDAHSDEEADSDLDDEQDEEAYDDDQGYSARQARKAKKPDIVVSSDDDDDLDDEEDDEEEDGEEGRELHENDRGWGTNKRAYYNTNDLDAMDSDSEIDEDQARELELKEVKRLQKKSRSVMDDADFGLGGDDGDSQLARSAKDASREQRRRDLDGDDHGALAPQITSNGVASTNGVAAGPADESSRRALLAKLQQTSPEAVALAGEYADMLEEFGRVDQLLNKMMAEQPNHASLEVMHVHYQTLATYITTMTFYFHLRASPEFAAEPTKLRTHPVMQRMMRLKQGLSVMEDLGLTFEPNRMPSTNGELSPDDIDEMQMLSQGSGGSEDDDLGDLDDDELADLMADADGSSGKENAAPVKAKRSAKQKRRSDDEDVENEDYTEDAQPKQRKKATKKEAGKKKVKKPEPVAPLAAGLADLDDEPALQVKLKKKGSAGGSAAKNPFAVSADATNFDDATFGELSELSSIESVERAARKRSLQFHASAIESKALQRAKAAKERQSGDADIPYRDRERSRAGVEATKAAREAKLQQQLNGGMGKDIALDGQDGWGDADEKDWRDVMGQPMESSSRSHRSGGDDDDNDDDDDAADYYDLVASSRKRARAEAKAEYDEARNAERFALMEDQELEDGEHRGITRQIEKNKGLTPHRPKTSRNPRVKKRLKYEKAKKKLGSRQAVYKGGQSNLQGGYGGEASGISTHLVKSRKLG